MNTNNPAFVFNCHYNGLSIIQDLGRHEVKVCALDSRNSVGTLSRYASFRRVPDPGKDEEGFITELHRLCEQQEYKPVLFPTNDHWAAALSRYRESLQDVSFPVVSSWGAVSTVLDKDVFYRLGYKRNYLTPKTWHPSMLNEIPDNEYPLVIKPRWRRMTSGFGPHYDPALLDQLRLIVVQDRVVAADTLRRFQGLESHLLLQTFVPGNCDQMYTVGVYANALSEIKAVFIGRKIRGYPAAYGDTAVGETASIQPDLLTVVERCVKELRLEGILEFEFKYDQSRERFWLIEINPRSWSWVGATAFCGQSLGWIAYLDRTGQELDSVNLVSDFEPGDLRYVFVHKDLPNVLIHHRQDVPAWVMGPRQWLADHRRGRKVIWADLQWDDPLPTLYSLFLTGRVMLTGACRHLRYLRR